MRTVNGGVLVVGIIFYINQNVINAFAKNIRDINKFIWISKP